jgi:hypothetical protein
MIPKNEPGLRGDPCPQLVGESSRNYQAFCQYRDMGPSRSLEGLRQIRSETASKTSLRWFQELSSKHGWVERARAFDKHMDMIRQKSREAVAASQARLWEERINQAIEDTYNDALMLRKLARRIMAMPVVETTSRDGRTVVKPGKWSFQTAAILAYKAAELQGLAFESIRKSRPLEEMSEEELRTIEDVRPEDFHQPPSSPGDDGSSFDVEILGEAIAEADET